MRIDLPLCNLKTCRYCFDGNCTDKIKYEQCEYTLAKTAFIPTAELDTSNDFAEWIDVNGDGSLWKCSRCGEEVCCKGNNFCPNCGARMKGGDEK